MRLYHATHWRNVLSIRRAGLRPDCSQGRLRAVWFCQRRDRFRAVLHVCQRHGWAPDEIVVITLEVPEATVRRSGHSWLRYTTRIVPGDAIRLLSPVRFTIDEGRDA